MLPIVCASVHAGHTQKISAMAIHSDLGQKGLGVLGDCHIAYSKPLCFMLKKKHTKRKSKINLNVCNLFVTFAP